jgi:hypothetical protein
MSALRGAGKPARKTLILRPIGVALGALALAGCSSAREPAAPNVFAWSMSAPSQRVAAPPLPKLEVEDDGLPVQASPDARIHQVPDDPSQPWSRNYGVNNGSPKPEIIPIPDAPAKEKLAKPKPQPEEEASVVVPDDAAAPRMRRATIRTSMVGSAPRCVRDGTGWRCSR